MKIFSAFVGILLLFCNISACSQTLDIFENINGSYASTGIFWNKATVTHDPPSTNDYTFPVNGITGELLNICHHASVDANNCVVPKYAEVKGAIIEVQRIQGAIPIAIVELNYNYISQNAVDYQWIFAAGSELFQLPG